MNTGKLLAAFFASNLLCLSGCQPKSNETESNAKTASNQTEMLSSEVKQEIESLPEKCSEKKDNEKKETPAPQAQNNDQQAENSADQASGQQRENSTDQASADNQNSNGDSNEEKPECYDDFSITGLAKFFSMSANIPPHQGIIVDLRNDAPDLNELEKDGDIEVTESGVLAAERTYLVEKKGGDQTISDQELIEKIEKSKFNAYIEYAELNYIYEATTKQPSLSPTPQPRQFIAPNQDPLMPNDPFFNKQANLRMIKLEEARKISEGEGIIVAVVDSGIIKTNDLSQNRFVKGYDFIAEKPIESPSDDFNTVEKYDNHGTHIAGTIAQETNNAFGFAGIAPKSRLMPIRVLEKVKKVIPGSRTSTPKGNAINIAKGIRWAVNNNADVINLSLAIKIDDVPFQERILGRAKNIVIRRALQYAKKKGVTVVAAAGNNAELSVLFPARDETVIAVAAYDQVGNRTAYSNYGKRVDIYAPGGEGLTNKAICSLPEPMPLLPNLELPPGIWQTVKGANGPKTEDQILGCHGTSQATAHVSGVVALIKSIFKKNGQAASPDIVKKILTLSERKCNEQWYDSSPDPDDPYYPRWRESETIMKAINDPFSPEKVGRIDALAAVEFAEQMVDSSKWRDNIELARHLKRQGIKVYRGFDCAKDSTLSANLGRLAFQELESIEWSKHNYHYYSCYDFAHHKDEHDKYMNFKHESYKHAHRQLREREDFFKVNGQIYCSSLTIEELADLSCYNEINRNFKVPEGQQKLEDWHKKFRKHHLSRIRENCQSKMAP
jgi:subtilisin family serine protease